MEDSIEKVVIKLPLIDARLLAKYYGESIQTPGSLESNFQLNLAHKLAAAAQEEENGVAAVEFLPTQEQDVASMLMLQMVSHIVSGGIMKGAGMFQSVLEMIKMMEVPTRGIAKPEFPAGDFAAVVFWLENNPLPDHYGPETKKALEDKLKAAIEGKSAHEVVNPGFDMSSDLDIDCLKLMIETTKAIAGRFSNASQATMEAIKGGVAIGVIKNIKIFIG
jgi:hypothetical protein